MTSPILKFRSNDKLKALVNNVKSILLVSQQNKIEQWEVTQCLWRNPDKHKNVGGGKRKSAWGRKKWWSQEKEKIYKRRAKKNDNKGGKRRSMLNKQENNFIKKQ